MKKQILMVVTSFETGGIMRSLQNFLNLYDTSCYDVDLFSMVNQGLYRNELNNCNILPFNFFLDASVVNIGKRHGVSKFVSFILKCLNKITRYRFQDMLFNRIGSGLLKYKKYDAVIAFSEGAPTHFVSFIRHHNKIAWIHCDYSSYLNYFGIKTELNTYSSFNTIVCVSEYTRRSFEGFYPSMHGRTEVIYNIMDVDMMRLKAMEHIMEPFQRTKFNIVSVGRIDPVKRLSIVPIIAHKIVQSGNDIIWYVIGPKGTTEETQRFYDNIKKYGMEKVVIPLGEKANPYPYIYKADLLVNTSVSEACPYVVNEGKILQTPVLCTDFGSSFEFLDNGNNGYIECIDNFAEKIQWIIMNPEKLRIVKEELSKFVYDNNIILQKIYNLFQKG